MKKNSNLEEAGKRKNKAMRAAMERRLGRQRKKTAFYFLAVSSGVLFAFAVLGDVFVSRVFLPNPVSFALAEQWLALLFTTITLLVLSIPIERGRRRSIGTRLDRAFAHITLPSRRIILDVILAGIFAGISTFAYYYVTGSGSDVAAVIPFSRISLIFLMIGDLILIRDHPTVIEAMSILAITFGVILVSSSPGVIDLSLLLFVLIIWGGGFAVSVFFQSRAKRSEIQPGVRTDSLNLRLWQLLFLNLTLTLLMLPFLTAEATLLLISNFINATPWLLIPVVFTFFSMITYLQALGKGKMSVVQGISSISVILGIPLNLIAALLLPTVFYPPAANPLYWLLMMIGIIFVVAGIIALPLSEMRGYVFIRVTHGTEDLLPILRRIHGVRRVSAIAGRWDYLIRIDIRSLGSAREKTLQKIEETPGVIDKETILILKEWD